MVAHEYWKDRRVLITGGAGFLGSHLVEALVSAGAKVFIIDKLTTGSLNNLTHLSQNSEVKILESDISNANWEHILGEWRIQTLFHLAGNANVTFSVEQPAWDFECNLDWTFRLLEAIRKSRWPGVLIFPSSGAVYGNPVTMPIHEEDPTVPISPYGVSKLAAERYISVYSKLYGIRAASVRPFSVYGPRQNKLVVYDLIQKIFNNQDELHIYGDGSQVRDFIFVEDAVRAMMFVAERGQLQGEVYNVASGQETAIQELVETLCSIMDAHPRLVYTGAVRPGEPEKWAVDINQINNLGFLPRVSLWEGLRRTVTWFSSFTKG